MKKILALVLAVAMLSTVAFAAANTTNYTKATNPDTTVLKLGMSDFTLDTDEAPVLGEAPVVKGGVVLEKYDFTSDNFTVQIKYKKGADLVKSASFNNDDNVLEVKLNKSTSLVAPADDKAANLIIESVKIKSKRTVKYGDKKALESGKTFVSDIANKEFWVGFAKNEQVVDEDYDLTDNTTVNAAGDTVYVPYTTWKGVSNGKQVGTTTYTEGDMTINGKVYAGDKVYMKIDSKYSDAVKDIAKANEDAEITAYNVTVDGLSASHTVTLNGEKDQKVYKLVDGKLAPSGLNWNEDEYAFTGKVRSTTTYLVSDIELKGVTTGGSETTNPDTGANDVVGIAAALAVVSLVAAGAVSLKK